MLNWVTSFWGGGGVAATEGGSVQQQPSPAPSTTSTRFEDLDLLGFLQTHSSWRDRQGRQVVMVAAKRYPASVVSTDALYEYICHTLAKVEEGAPFVVLWLHTCATYWANCPSVQWLWNAYERLPEHYRTSCQGLHIMHCDAALWGATLSVGPMLSAGLWGKISWISRLEFLDELVEKCACPQLWAAIPSYVQDHDASLEDQPLADYGVIAPPKELASWACPPSL